tara:strand:- start:1184 stop:1780 length:597 start_codon:yes stop_codon:yes gene_type:complete
MGIRKRPIKRVSKKVISPNRELAFQVVENRYDLFKHLPSYKNIIQIGDYKAEEAEWLIYLSNPKSLKFIHNWDIHSEDKGFRKSEEMEYIVAKSKLAKHPNVDIFNMDHSEYVKIVKNRSLDIVIVSNLLEKNYLTSWFRKLRPRGIMVFSKINTNISSVDEAYEKLGRLLPVGNKRKFFHIRYLTFERNPAIAIQRP